MSVEERMRWMEAYEATRNAGAVCARFRISRPTLRKWWGRYKLSGPKGLEDTSRRPASSPNKKVFEREEALILDLRKSQRLGVHRLKQELHRRNGIDLSAETILKVLKRAGEPMKTARSNATEHPRQFGVGGLFHGLGVDDRVANAIASLIVSERFQPGQKLSEFISRRSSASVARSSARRCGALPPRESSRCSETAAPSSRILR